MITLAPENSQVFYLVKLKLGYCNSEFSEFEHDFSEAFGGDTRDFHTVGNSELSLHMAVLRVHSSVSFLVESLPRSQCLDL